MRLFGSDRVQRLMQAMGLEKGEAIEHKMVSNAVERARRRSRDATSISASNCSSMTTWPTISAA